MQLPSPLKQLFRTKDIADLQSEVASEPGEHTLTKNLSLLDLTCFGIAAVIGAGIFSTIGSAAANGGPAVSLLFVLTAVTCLFSALCYAEFASRIPVSGSAYTYSYAAFGEIIAWLIGWNLLMEYAIGNSVIAFSWSDYFSNLLHGFGISIPDWLSTDYYSCAEAADVIRNATTDTVIPDVTKKLAAIWNEAPIVAGLRVIVDVPALFINLVVTCLVYIGIKESKIVSNMMVFLKLAVVLLVIAVGVFYVAPSNWYPFAPKGVTGVFQGIANVFFAYIGFDAISTTAEECKNPQKDIPRATVFTLALCTLLYVILSLVLTGMVPYSELGVDDPLAFVFSKYKLDFVVGLVSISAVVAITSVFLVFQLGQPRILMSMARDGLLPKRFASVHPRFKTPAFSTIITGIAVAIPTIFLNSQFVLDLCSIGTLFAFVLVSAGILMVGDKPGSNPGQSNKGFRVPYINGRYIMPVLLAGYVWLLFYFLPDNHNVFTTWDKHKLPYIFFFAVFIGMTILSVVKCSSLIPVLGVITNLYLIAGLGYGNWKRFAIWCVIGLVVYFAYGFANSRLQKRSQEQATS